MWVCVFMNFWSFTLFSSVLSILFTLNLKSAWEKIRGIINQIEILGLKTWSEDVDDKLRVKVLKRKLREKGLRPAGMARAVSKRCVCGVRPWDYNIRLGNWSKTRLLGGEILSVLKCETLSKQRTQNLVWKQRVLLFTKRHIFKIQLQALRKWNLKYWNCDKAKSLKLRIW